MELHKKRCCPVERWCCPSYWKGWKKLFVSFDTNTNSLLISSGTHEQLSAFQNQYIQNKTIIVRLPSDILRSYPQSSVAFFFWPEFLWSHWCCSLCIPSFILFDSQRHILRNPAKKGRGQTCDIFWAMYVYVTQQGSFPSKMEIACIAAAVSYDGSMVERVGKNCWGGSSLLCLQISYSTCLTGFLWGPILFMYCLLEAYLLNKWWWKGRVKTCSNPVGRH